MNWVYNATPAVDAESRYPVIIGVSVTFCCLMLAVVVVRGIHRRRCLCQDDFVIFVTALFSVMYTISCCVQTRWGLGLPTAMRPIQNLHTFRQLSYAGKPWYQLTLGGYKVALCIGYTRFLAGTDMHLHRRVILVVGVLCAATQLSFVMLNLFSCMPITKIFDYSIEGTCMPFLRTQYPMAITGIVSDVVVFLLPIPLFVRLSFSRRTIVGLCILFGCGLITTICSVIRATHLKAVGPTGNGDNTAVVLWGTIEVNVGIIMSCLPFLQALLAGVIRKGSRSLNNFRKDKLNCGGDSEGSTITYPSRKSNDTENFNMPLGQSKSPTPSEKARPDVIVKTTHVEILDNDNDKVP